MARRILCFGDSNTWGYDPCSPLGERYPDQVRWVDALARGHGWETLNWGENGRPTPHEPWVLEALARELPHWGRVDDMTVMLGVNDLHQAQRPDADATAARMERFLRWLLGRLDPETRLTLVAPPHMAPGTWTSGELGERMLAESFRLGAAYRAVAQRLGIHFADGSAWEVEMAFDGVHFTEAGHRTFARGLGETLARYER